jgi:hypothetical protein
MNIREISDVFKDTAGDIEALKSYNFGWASDRVRQGNTEDFQELNQFPRVFFSVPTITASDQIRKQDTYQITLFFDDLLGYDNEGDADLTLQIDKWAALQNYATAFIQRLNLIKQSILPNYLFIPEPPQFTFDSFVGIQRLVTVQINFNLVVPTNCEVKVQRIIEFVGNAIATATTQANIFLSTRVSAFVECKATATGFIVVGQQNVIEVNASVTAFALASGDIVRVKNVSANVISTATVQAEVQRAVNIIGELNATGQVTGNINLTLFATGSATGTANVSANLEVTTKGIVQCEANVTGTSVMNGLLFVIRTLEAISIGQSTTQSEIILSKLLSASVIGLGVSEGNVQRVISLSSSVDTSVTTSAEAQVTIPVTAQATATAQTSSEAQITRIISAEAIATANSSADANFGITLNAGIEAKANVISANLFRAATLDASVTGTANTTSVLTLADNLTASITGTATVTNSNLQLFDPNFANVSLLLHGNGTNGSTTFTDSSSNALVVTSVGDAKINTTTFKFPTGSIALDGTGDFLIVTGGTGFEYGTGNFTIECFVYFNSVSGAKIIYDQRITGNETQRPTIYHNGTVLTYYVAGDRITGGTLTTGVWHHIAVSRSGTSTRMYLNGTQIGSTYTDNTNYLNGVNRPLIGSDGFAGANFLNGFVDDLRVTKGVARYTGATITVPTSQFPDQ